MNINRNLLFSCCCMLLTHCGNQTHVAPKDPNCSSNKHIIPTDSYGYTYGVGQTRSSDGSTETAQTHLNRRMDALDEGFRAAGNVKEVMVFIHGGLNSQASAIEYARRVKAELATDRKDIFPVFITWDSGLLSTYAWHLRRDGNGIVDIDNRSKADDFRTIPRVPVLLASDLAAGVGTAPKTIYNATGKAMQNWDWLYKRTPQSFPTRMRYEKALKELTGNKHAPLKGAYSSSGNGLAKFEFSLGAANSTFESKASRAVGGVMLPMPTVLSPIYDGVAKPAWKNMLRRAKTLVYRSPTFVQGGMGDQPADGVVPEVLRHIAAWQSRKPNLKVTFVGHSMGTIVFNEAFRAMEAERHLKPGKGCDVKVDRVIYLAAACSIRDFRDSVGRYMKRNPDCEIYNLTLHPKREVGEKTYPLLPLVFSGSLLTWIDEFLQDPIDFQERTFGSFENCIIAYRLLPQSPKFHLKAFEENESLINRPRKKSGPQKHGEMTKFCFWDPWFYQPVKKGQSIPDYREIK